MHSLTFKNHQAVYEIKDESKAEHNENSARIIIKANGKKIELAGRVPSKNGSLGLLMDKEELIHNFYQDDTERY